MIDKTNWLEICKRRFPNLRVVEGSGPLAVVRQCNSTIVLCGLPIEARSVAEKDCCKNCARHVQGIYYHTVVELKPDPVASAFRRNSSLHKMMMAED
jgi:hypothetical protein